MKSPYFDSIREEIVRQGKIGIDPRHVEAFMRLEHSTLDGLHKSQFKSEVSISIQCIEQGGVTNAENCAKSFGL
jgi:hypothetical protein